MTFLICPRWKRDHSLSPEVITRSRQEAESQPREQDAARSSLSSSRKKPESFTHKVRRKLSRDSKLSTNPYVHERLDPSGRHHGIERLGFTFTRKPDRLAMPKTVNGITVMRDNGSSLMSARGYDSDAQYVSTPTRYGAFERSPTSRAFPRGELSDLAEQSQEQTGIERSEAAWSENDEPWRIGKRMGYNGLRYPEGGTRYPPNTARGIPTYQSTHPDIPVDDIAEPWSQSIPSLLSINQGVSPLQPESTPPGDHDRKNRGLLGEWNHFMKKSGLASMGSQSSPSASTTTEIANFKTRHPAHSASSFNEPRSLNLSALGVNLRAPQVVSPDPTLGNQSYTGLVRGHRYGMLLPGPPKENMQLRSGSAGSVIPRLSPLMNSRDASSCYSRKPSSIRGNESAGNQKSPNQSLDRISLYDDVPAPDGRVLSKFHEHIDSSMASLSSSYVPHAKSNHRNDSDSTRKLSSGWMSGGRRVGYGYSPVFDGESDSAAQDEATRLRSYSPTPEVITLRGHTPTPTPTTGPSNQSKSAVPTMPPPDTSYHAGNGQKVLPPLPPLPARVGHPRPIVVSPKRDQDHPAPNSAPLLQVEHCEVPQISNCINERRDPSARPWGRFSWHKRILIGNDDVQQSVPNNSSPSPTNAVATLSTEDTLEEPEPDTVDMSFPENHGLARRMSRSNSVVSKWIGRYSKYKDGRRLSTVRQQEPSQSSSDQFEDCEPSTPPPSVPADDGDFLEMPGSFEGSRWASRVSRYFG